MKKSLNILQNSLESEALAPNKTRLKPSFPSFTRTLLSAILILTGVSTASLLDFKYLEEAKEAYNDKNYSKAQELYGKVDYNEAKFNQADSLYRQKKYQEAIDVYKSITEPKLEAEKLHNIGNSYAQMKKVDEAIKSYEEALKLNDDTDTKFNLELLKKRKEEEKKKKDKKNDKENNKEDKNQEQKDSDKDKSQEQKEQEKKKSEDEKKSEEQKIKDKEAQKKREEEHKKEQEKRKAQNAEQNQTQPPISNMEERKWQKMLNQRGVKTLMIPLNKGKKENETNLW